ncbi:MAG: iron chelate uptake ABC transporter family permease subunit [Chlamydiota bacterium]
MSLWLTDTVLRGPLLGSILMSLCTALVGAITLMRKKALIGETLSHATFPGVAIGMLIAGYNFPNKEGLTFVCILLGAFISALCAQFFIEKLLKYREKSDVALCYILASFLGAGVLLVSFIQQAHAIWYRTIQVFFYGQAATMTDFHVVIYAVLSLCVCFVITLLYRPIKAVCFDPVFSQAIGIKKNWVFQILSVLLSLAIVIGIRCAGVVLITGMLIAPAIVSRCLTKRFSSFLIVSSCVGVISSALGNYITTIPVNSGLSLHYIPTGPSTVMVASILAFLALLLSSRKGLLPKLFRRWKFQKNCLLENLLKAIWKESTVNFKHILKWNLATPWMVFYALKKLAHQGWILKEKGIYRLTDDGNKKAAYIVRLHRLWELYLAQNLGGAVEHIHHSAEEMEHLITPDIEAKLTKVLFNPTKDPHKQPIPSKELL